ncbi:Uncharacterized membrane protein HdeD, DUF308 family [Actinopolymorpha cephalotaxi]|uniref:Uncharacterized membrane protein HdeD (DUF308 family) n=1 Tax=Actinopolymorpha cephalotaxi TaxID=504797 RepID=A0A1I2YZ44_9ACTN|nr:DUF308 domain-containing protein [Actinopolymorpha cephalotaxi]NYH81737.1 uncharacterized membrane protein HdeD (DUF308 family) [Actinopolymorpha cephalotaxi]SFH29981.1 Uncharacterized membrane protein HdeD, DUF308 family [Actinopolymorpha cephalotaxi]
MSGNPGNPGTDVVEEGPRPRRAGRADSGSGSGSDSGSATRAQPLRRAPRPGVETWAHLAALGGWTLVFGLLVLAWPRLPVVEFQTLVGGWFFAVGTTRLATTMLVAGRARLSGESVYSALLGVLLVASSALCLRGLVTTVVLLVVLVALHWLLSGFGELMAALAGRPGGRGWQFVAGLVAVGVGVAFLLLPDLSLSTVVPMTAVSSLGAAGVQIVAAFAMRPVPAPVSAPM